jgi:beta-lactamase regulating signal transducer with metallopeptidase domain
MFSFVNPMGIGSNFLQALGWAILNSLWQMAFLWVLFQVILSFGVNKSSAKSRLAAVLMTAGFGWFLYTLVYHWLINPDAIKSSLLAIGSFENGNAMWNEQLKSILPFASVVYLLLLIIPIIQFIRNYRFVQIIRKAGLSKCHVDLRIFVQRFGERMGIPKPVRLYISDLITSPVTIGFLKPIILMPIAAITNLTEKQVEAVLLHELAHIRRYDYFINLVINFVRTILYFNPFVKSFAKIIEREREKSCDEIVMQFEYDPHGYASALLVLERNNFVKQTIAVAASGQRNDLLHRIERILGIEKRKTPDLRKLGGLLAGLMCVIALNALFFFSSPVIQTQSLAFTAFSSPFYQLVSDGKISPAADKPIENKRQQTQTLVLVRKETRENERAEHSTSVTRNISFSIKDLKVNVVNTTPRTHFVYSTSEVKNGLALVDQKMHVEPALKKAEMAQVNEAVAATRKVLEEGQWKQVEKNIADVLTEVEKENLKEKYYNELDKVNWRRLEERLRLSYDRINWNKVNAQLNTAITNIKLDSFTTVYNSALADLNIAQNWMTENQVECIPDTDLKMGEVKIQTQQIQKQLERIKAVKAKKIIHL